MKQVLNYFFISIVGVFLLATPQAAAQVSTNTVKYQVTYNSGTDLYTAFVIPDYAVPNGNNTTATEKGATAQFTLVVPKAFVITQVTDIKGTWSKPGDPGFIKLGPGNPGQSYPGLDPNLNYYVIGKSASETDYGTFAPNVPVALFTFKGNSCYGPIKPLPKNDPFISAADTQASLNVANNFFSRSGQSNTGNSIPLEQFTGLAGNAAECCLNPLCIPVSFVLIKR